MAKSLNLRYTFRAAPGMDWLTWPRNSVLWGHVSERNKHFCPQTADTLVRKINRKQTSK